MRKRPQPPSTTREKLIAAAVTVVARDGFEAASVKAIADEAGVAPGLLHYHFASKEALLEAALRDALGAYLDELKAWITVTDRENLIKHLFDDAVVAMDRDRDLFRLRLAFAVKALVEPSLAAVVNELNAAAVQENARIYAAARGEALPSRHDVTMATILKACFDGILLNAMLDPEFPRHAARDLLEAGVRASLD